jgi:hypothetical protein
MLHEYSDTLRTETPRRKLEVKICAVNLKISNQKQTRFTVRAPTDGFLPHYSFRTHDSSSLGVCLFPSSGNTLQKKTFYVF